MVYALQYQIFKQNIIIYVKMSNPIHYIMMQLFFYL